MSKRNSYPAVTKDFGDSFGMSPSFEEFKEKEEKTIMSHTIERLQRTDILKNALATAQPKPSRSTHLKLLDEHEWKLVHEARKNGSKAGLQQLFISMQRAYQDNDEAFFATYAQFYNAYRQATQVYGLAPIRPRKPKSE
jgi:hypothetical protein